MKDEMSKYRRRLFGGLIFYGIFSLGIIPFFTLIMGTKDNILTTSMSAMGNTSGNMHFWFIIWTIVFCAYFASFMGYLLMLTKNTHSKIRGFVYFATVSYTHLDVYKRQSTHQSSALPDRCPEVSACKRTSF